VSSGGVKLEGFTELEKDLKTLGERVQRKVLRSAVSAAATPVLKAAKAKTPKQSGTLKKSLGRKIVTNKKTQSVTAIIGPRRGVTGEYEGKERVPSRYAHLVENGHIDSAGNYVPGQPFLNPAMSEEEASAMTKLKDKLKEGIEKEAKKGQRQ
jgi:HK97 gp10 family phage protein